jgi:hypothetical protein
LQPQEYCTEWYFMCLNNETKQLCHKLLVRCHPQSNTINSGCRKVPSNYKQKFWLVREAGCYTPGPPPSSGTWQPEDGAQSKPIAINSLTLSVCTNYPHNNSLTLHLCTNHLHAHPHFLCVIPAY